MNQNSFRGRVIGQLPGGRVRVEARPGAACTRCANGRGCGLGLVSDTMSEIDCDVDGTTLPNGVAVDIHPCSSDHGWLPVVAGAYGLPTVGLLGGVVAGAVWEAHWSGTVGMPGDFLAAAAGLAGLAGGVLAWRVLSTCGRLKGRQGPLARPVPNTVAVPLSQCRPSRIQQ